MTGDTGVSSEVPPPRLRLLLDAVVAMAADLSLDGVLARIVSVASTLVDAEYAALGVLDAGPERRLRTIIHHGLTPEQVEEIGDLPTGQGLLGLLIDRPEPLRLHDIADHPAAYGFPPQHPPMSSFLGVPVRIRDQVFGNLFLTQKRGGGDFDEADEEVVVALAAAAGVAIENARLYEEAAQREAWLAATAEVIRRLSQATPTADALQIIADLAHEVAGADATWIVTGQDPSQLALRVVSGLPADQALLDGVPLDRSLARDVIETREALVVANLDAESRAIGFTTQFGWPELGPAIIAPLGAVAGVGGALGLAWTPDHTDQYRLMDAQHLQMFAEQAGLALRVSQVREDRQRLAVFEDRDRIGRDLHDLVIQRLFSVGLGLQGAVKLADRPELAERLERAVDDIDATIKDIRRSIFELGAGDWSLDVESEVTRVVERAGVALTVRPTVRFQGPVRSLVGPEVVPDLLAVLAEALSNVGRHAEATTVDVLLEAGREITLTVVDDGQGLPADVAESGLGNIRQRAERHQGTFEVGPAPGHGTRLRWSVPLTSD